MTETTTSTTMMPKEFDVTASHRQLDRDVVQKALRDDGAIILSNLHHLQSPSHSSSSSLSWSDIAANVPTLVFDKQQLLLLRDPKQQQQQEGGGGGEGPTTTTVPIGHHRADPVHVEHSQLGLEGASLAPHSDGYIWGDNFPDVVVLVCEQPAADADADAAAGGDGFDGGGANYLIDGLNVVKRLDPTTLDLLQTTIVDHTERVDGGSFVDGAESFVPVIRWLPTNSTESSKRLCWRRMVGDSNEQEKKNEKVDGNFEEQQREEDPYLSLWLPVESDDEELKIRTKRALLEVDRAIEEESKVAKRFTLKKGQAMVVDNFRMLHAREAFKGQESVRRMWRVWTWTTASFGLPPQFFCDHVVVDHRYQR
mmetsp:Transcript_56253/g.136371  ORF Transcript_56253/g.136371 Transcript_56253/m.136371 type:complete len:367 (+) Transcript_56253:122-1222(+)